MTKRTMSGIVLALVLAAAAPAVAQPEFEINAHVGGIKWDEQFMDIGTELLAGGRLVLQLPGGWGLGGNFDWSKSDIGETGVEVTSLLYSGEIDYTFGSSGPVRFFVGAGVGAISRTIELSDEDVDESDLAIPLALGLKYMPGGSSRWAVRADLRDHLIRSTDPENEEENQTTNNFEFSAGLSVLLGGGS
jgi:outer membrane protein with beta-barrel domain